MEVRVAGWLHMGKKEKGKGKQGKKDKKTVELSFIRNAHVFNILDGIFCSLLNYSTESVMALTRYKPFTS